MAFVGNNENDIMSCFSCQICLEFYNTSDKQPLVLPCGHVFCKECLGQLRVKSCPSCRLNWTHRTLGELVCCHQLIPDDPSEFGQKVKKSVLCEEHHDSLSGWCNTHEIAVCLSCVAKTHSSCSWMPLKEVLQKERSEMAILIQNRTKFIHDVFSPFIGKLLIKNDAMHSWLLKAERLMKDQFDSDSAERIYSFLALKSESTKIATDISECIYQFMSTIEPEKSPSQDFKQLSIQPSHLNKETSFENCIQTTPDFQQISARQSAKHQEFKQQAPHIFTFDSARTSQSANRDVRTDLRPHSESSIQDTPHIYAELQANKCNVADVWRVSDSKNTLSPPEVSKCSAARKSTAFSSRAVPTLFGKEKKEFEIFISELKSHLTNKSKPNSKKTGTDTK